MAPPLDAAAIQRDKLACLGELTAGIAHELNNPIGFVTSNLSALGRYADTLAGLVEEAGALLPPEARAAWRDRLVAARYERMRADLPVILADTREGCELLKTVVNDLKSLARSSQTAEDASLDACVRAALGILAHQLRHRFRVDTDLAAARPLRLLRAQVIQAVINLVHNAIQAQPAGGSIRLASSDDGVRASLVVEDAGPGIPDELRQRVFEPYFTSKPSGTGLGLAIVAQIAATHGGGVTADASSLGGARFTLVLSGCR